MAKLIDISDEINGERVERWLNLDNVLYLETMEKHGLVSGRDPSTVHVVVYTRPGGTGQILPERITLREVLERMQPGAWLGRR